MTLLTETEAAEVLRISLPSLRRWRKLGTGPRFSRMTHLIRYQPSAIREFVEQRTVSRPHGEDSDATSEARQAARQAA